MKPTTHHALISLALGLAALACNAGAVLDPGGSGGESPTTAPSTPMPPALTSIPTNSPPTPTKIPPTPVIDVPTEFEDAGRTLYLESEHVRLGVDTRWGGAIREIWFQGDNLVNNYDGGRLIAVAFYDSDLPATTTHPNDTGWNPTPSDMHDHANPPLESSFQDGTLYLKNRYLQWFPNDKGGGPGRAVATDVIVETWLRFFTDPRVIELRYRLTNESDRDHAVHAQEFPFAYLRTPYQRYVTYAGDRPWTSDEVTSRAVPMDRASQGVTAASERWAGLFNDAGRGLTMWAPQAYPNFSYKHFNVTGPAEIDSLYLQPRTFLAIRANASIETRAYLLIGTRQVARQHIYRLHESFKFPDVIYPYGFIDAPQAGDEVSGTVNVGGWAIDDRGLDFIEIRVDGEPVGRANYGRRRPDLVEKYPGLPGAPNHGYGYSLDTGPLSAGEHALTAIAVDAAGNASTLRPGAISVVVSE